MATQSSSRVGLRLRELYSLESYKRSQGRRVRWSSFWGFLILALWGLWRMWQLLVLAMPVGWDRERWVWISYGVPLGLGLLSAWIIFRICWGWQRFGDFLIATEAEMAKVSWSKQPEIVQATVVVLVTVFAMAGYLFLVDTLWSRLLQFIGVLQKPGLEAMAQPLAEELVGCMQRMGLC